MAEFDDPTDLVNAAHRAYEEGYRRMDAYSPFPIEELSEAIGFHHTKIRVVQQDQIVDGIECVGPLSVRTQNLFHKSQIFNRQSQLVGRGGQKFHLIGRVGK